MINKRVRSQYYFSSPAIEGKAQNLLYKGKMLCLCCWFKNIIIQNHPPEFNIQHYAKLLFHHLLFAKLLRPVLYIGLHQGVEGKISVKNMPCVKKDAHNQLFWQYTINLSQKQKVVMERYLLNYTKTQKSPCTWKKHFVTDGAAAGRSCPDINVVIAGLKTVKTLRVCSLTTPLSIHVPSCHGTERKT